MKIDIYAHLGGSKATSACSDVIEYDMFTGHRDMVSCPHCLDFISRSWKKAKRFVVDYNADKALWGVYDRKQSAFVASAGSIAGARIIRARLASNYR